jgi:hypothetical protein
MELQCNKNNFVVKQPIGMFINSYVIDRELDGHWIGTNSKCESRLFIDISSNDHCVVKMWLSVLDMLNNLCWWQFSFVCGNNRIQLFIEGQLEGWALTHQYKLYLENIQEFYLMTKVSQLNWTIHFHSHGNVINGCDPLVFKDFYRKWYKINWNIFTLIDLVTISSITNLNAEIYFERSRWKCIEPYF